MDYKENSLNIIKDAHILQTEDFDIINNLKEQLEDVFRHAQVFRTRTEMEVSVLNDVKFPTADSKYWQSVREQNVMFQELVNSSYEYRKNQVEIRKLERDLAKETDDLEKELIQIEIERKQFLALNQQRTAKDRIREIKEWEEIKQGLISDMQYSLVDVNEHQLISYTQRWINQAIIMGENGSPAERHNLIGQLQNGLKMCQEKGVLDKALLPFDKEIILQLTGGEING
jgi:hypothetical protein